MRNTAPATCVGLGPGHSAENFNALLMLRDGKRHQPIPFLRSSFLSISPATATRLRGDMLLLTKLLRLLEKAYDRLVISVSAMLAVILRPPCPAQIRVSSPWGKAWQLAHNCRGTRSLICVAQQPTVLAAEGVRMDIGLQRIVGRNCSCLERKNDGQNSSRMAGRKGKN